MRALVLSMLVVFGLYGGPATAQTLDLSTIKCRDFVGSSKESIGLILAWLNAYYKDEDAPPILDFGQFEKDAARLGAYCGANPETGLITAADSLFDK